MSENESSPRGVLRRARGRARLEALASASVEKTREQCELERLKTYLLEWSQRQKSGYSVGGGASTALAQYQKSGSPEATELLKESDGWAMSIIDAAIDSLSTLEDGLMMRAALRVRYLNEGLVPGAGELKIRVFRSGRLQDMSLMECDELADRAEISLIPIAKRRGLPL